MKKEMAKMKEKMEKMSAEPAAEKTLPASKKFGAGRKCSYTGAS
jgi:hypothetical protein